MRFMQDKVIQVGVAKRAAEPSKPTDEIMGDKILTVMVGAERLIKVAAVSVAGYVLLDTFRQVQIAKALK